MCVGAQEIVPPLKKLKRKGAGYIAVHVCNPSLQEPEASQGCRVRPLENDMHS